MKKTSYAFLVLGIVFILLQCTSPEKDNRTLITKKIQYDVPIVNPDATHDWWIRNIEGSDREQLLENIFQRVLEGDVQAYDYFNKPLTVGQVKSILNDTIIRTLMRPAEPFTEYDTAIINTIGPENITLLRFLEEWKYDEKNLKIDKKIYAISPVMEVSVNGRQVTRPLFWIYTDESILK
jgi:hypothetical protein